MTDIFLRVLNISIAASWLILAVMLLRPAAQTRGRLGHAAALGRGGGEAGAAGVD